MTMVRRSVLVRHSWIKRFLPRTLRDLSQDRDNGSKTAFAKADSQHVFHAIKSTHMAKYLLRQKTFLLFCFPMD